MEMTEKEELVLIPPTDPRVLSAIAPFNNDMLKDEGYKDRKELTEDMFKAMHRYGGIGLSANQVGLPFNMFVVGNHISLENGLKMACFNPMIVSTSEELIMMKEGCLTYPFLFLSIQRPRKCVVKYTDENGTAETSKGTRSSQRKLSALCCTGIFSLNDLKIEKKNILE